ncbi:MAG: peptidoglycan DD-metalloendopeptidase family protein [Cryomorphaceae bacterium]|nr:peptidoglycan DD-metalloendopeptidase family protein [Cryomorphaceae bacterium]
MTKKTKGRKKYKVSIWFTSIVLVVAVLATAGLFYWEKFKTVPEPIEFTPLPDEPVKMSSPFKRFGFDTVAYRFDDAELRSGETFGNLLIKAGFSNQAVYDIVEASLDVFEVRRVIPGEKYHFVFDKADTSNLPNYLIYEKNPLVYYHFTLQGNVGVRRIERETKTRVDTASAIVTSSLYEALRAEGVPVKTIMTLADVYGWVIDFFRIQKGDYVKLLYELDVVDDSIVVGIGKIPAARFYHAGKDWNAFYYASEDGAYRGYFDENGDAMRKAFLKAPLDFFRISSRYNPRRFHPVLKKMKPHLGTDYAAPTGTPIRTTSDGEIEKMGYTSGNGNFIKVRHNSTYSTQYLHMSRFADGMRMGKAVSQGDVIGYVGATGLATGPHVCYRFWKNGVQVDPLKEELPAAEPIEEAHRQNFEAELRVKMGVLDIIPLDTSSSSK